MRRSVIGVSLCAAILAFSAVAMRSTAGEEAAAGETKLNLFEKADAWKLGKVNAKGTFEVAKEGDKAIGVINFDFSGEAAGGGGRYVLITTDVQIPDTAKELQVQARSTKGIRVTVRVVDSTGQTHQYKSKISGKGTWEPVKVSLTKKTEHWGGDNDGKIHFPTKQISLSVTAPDEPKGKVEFADLVTLAK